MRLRIRHETNFTYEQPIRRATESLRLWPRAHDGLYLVNWRIDVSADCRLYATHDAFGNNVHDFTIEGQFEELSIVAEGTVETTETNGVLSGEVERFPPAIYLRDTPLTRADMPLRALAERFTPDLGGDRVALLHRIMAEVHEALQFRKDETDSGTSAEEAYRHGAGVCQDFAHVFIAVCRHLGIPARYAGGYLYHGGGSDERAAGHAWAEALVEGLGWVGFDPAKDRSPTEAYVRVAIGLDYLGAAPIRGARYGGDGEEMKVKITVDEVAR